MRKFVISLALFLLSSVLIIYALSNMSVFTLRSLDTDLFSSSIASVNRTLKRRVGENFFSFSRVSLKRDLEALPYVRSALISSSSFMDYDVSLEYEDGLVLSDNERFYFFNGEEIESLDERDVFPLLSRYIHFVMTKEMLSYVLSFPTDGSIFPILGLLMDIQGQNGYNENLIGRVEYSLSSGNGFGEISLYGRTKDFVLFVTDETDSSFLSSSLERIGEMDFLDREVFEIRDDIFFRRMD